MQGRPCCFPPLPAPCSVKPCHDNPRRSLEDGCVWQRLAHGRVARCLGAHAPRRVRLVCRNVAKVEEALHGGALGHDLGQAGRPVGVDVLVPAEAVAATSKWLSIRTSTIKGKQGWQHSHSVTVTASVQMQASAVAGLRSWWERHKRLQRTAACTPPATHAVHIKPCQQPGWLT